MKRPIRWVREGIVHAIHQRQLAEHGGLDGVRDPATLKSALDRPRNLIAYRPEADAAELAASYGIAKNHPFMDGNKRTAHVVYQLFLEINGLRNTWPQAEKYEAMLKLASGTLSETDFAAYLRDAIEKLQS